MRWLPAVLAVLLVSFACATAPVRPDSTAAAATASSSGSLFDRLGGVPGLETVVDDFLARISKDDRINASFAMTDVPRLRRRLVELLCKTTGGPCVYSGRDMKAVHAGMGISGSQFGALAGHLVAALDAAHVRPEDKNAVIGAVSGMRPDIVEEP